MLHGPLTGADPRSGWTSWMMRRCLPKQTRGDRRAVLRPQGAGSPGCWISCLPDGALELAGALFLDLDRDRVRRGRWITWPPTPGSTPLRRRARVASTRVVADQLGDLVGRRHGRRGLAGRGARAVTAAPRHRPGRWRCCDRSRGFDPTLARPPSSRLRLMQRADWILDQHRTRAGRGDPARHRLC